MTTRKYGAIKMFTIWDFCLAAQIVLAVVIGVSLILQGLYQYSALKPTDFPDLSHEVVEVVEVEEEISPQEEHALLLREIVYQSVLAGIDPISALKIAKCESRYDEAAKNKNSSAKGLYQFIDRTWKGYCTGDPLVAEDSINCFVKLYKQHPGYWVCKG